MKRRVLLGMALDGKTGRAFHAPVEPSKDELDAITRRQAMRVLERADLDAYERQMRVREQMRFYAAVCIGVVAAAALATAIAAMIP